jgi:peroxiredoxin
MAHPRSVLPLLLLATAAAGQATSPAKVYQALVRDYEAALKEFQKASDAAPTPEAKEKAFRDRFPRPAAWAPRFMEFATRYPASQSAVEALTWVVDHPAEQSAPEHALRAKALGLLQTKHIADERVGRLCTGLVFTIDPASETFLRQVFAKAPSAGARARACASLAHNLKYRSRLARALREDADLLKDYQQTYGKPMLDGLLKRDADKLAAESRDLFRHVEAKFGKMPHPLHGTLGKLAEAHLASLAKPVTVDQPAPEIDGTDTEGKPLRLSAFKGKVVLLDFWGDEFPLSRAAYGYQKGLAKRLAGKPFVMLGVSADPDRIAADKLRKKEGLAWRSWWDGGHVGGPIATRWEIDHWPTVVVIDHKGVVRDVSAGWPPRKELDALLDKLVAEAGKK